MVGYPGSGKSTIAKNIAKIFNFKHIERDILKTESKMIKIAKEYAKDNLSIIFDATNNTIKKRKVFIDFANKFDYNIKCIFVSTSFNDSYERNLKREKDKIVPKVAYYVFKKYFEEPNENEGFKLIKI